MRWRPFRLGEAVYGLRHLNPVTVTYIQEAKADRPAHCYTVDVIFSLHCFTRGIQAGECPPPELCYSDGRETRVFDFRRYELSKYLPQIVTGFSKRKVYHSGRGNFFCIEVVDQTGKKVEYEVYFVVSRSSKKGVVNLLVQSAYVRDPKHLSNRPRRKPIGFHVILHNVLNNKQIRVP